MQQKTSKDINIAVIGCGISGIQALKACKREDLNVVCFEKEKEIGGTWRFKEDGISVYQSTHIDTPRDLNAYGDCAWNVDKNPVVIHNTKLVGYLSENADKFGLRDSIRFNTEVVSLSPIMSNTSNNSDSNSGNNSSNGKCKWLLKYRHSDRSINNNNNNNNNNNEDVVEEQIFDGVMICTGRHSCPYVPSFPGEEKFRGIIIHSTQYKHSTYPANIAGKNIVVVGIGNSGSDITSETARSAKQVFLVARSGSWIVHAPGEKIFTSSVSTRLSTKLLEDLPFDWQNAIVERIPALKDQEILNRAGLKPKHRFFQAHVTATGIGNADYTIFTALKEKKLTVKKNIKEITETGVIFDDGSFTEADIIIKATGFRQVCPFIDEKVVNLKATREGNQVDLFNYMFPITNESYQSLCFINYVQSPTFLCADIQTIFYVNMMKGKISLPPLSQQIEQGKVLKDFLSQRYTSSQRHQIQGGLLISYYDAMAKVVGCYPDLWELLKNDPSAIFHAWLTPWTAYQYRLIGPYADDVEGTKRLIMAQYMNLYAHLGYQRFFQTTGQVMSLGFLSLIHAITNPLSFSSSSPSSLFQPGRRMVAKL